MQFLLKALHGTSTGELFFQPRVDSPGRFFGRRTVNRPLPPACAFDEPGRKLETILVPTDFSPRSARAIARAVSLANQSAARIAILHVIDVTTCPEPGETAAHLMKQMWDESFRQMGQLACSLAGQVEARTLIEEGLPWEEIVEKSRDADLVVLGKDKPARRWNLFSKHTADRVIADAACPVMVVSNIAADRFPQARQAS